ncbi:unnamed protein product [Lactuca virosa]|uniref:SWIM-type domain-containing protein n=1 Tax=Lactuca virosa TaxID=75947 RepID=A0AAU9N277_9ASTR|nr:unnamed protein product [Lactuca virosa]
MSSLNSCSDLHSTINEQSLHDQSSSNMNIDHSNNSNSCSDLHSIINEQSLHDQSSSSMNIDHSNSSNSRYSFDFELYNAEKCGFDVNMSSQKRYSDGTIRIRYSTCSRSGFTESFKNENVNVKFSDVKRRRTSSKKNGCPAVSKFKNLRCSLMFYIYVFVEDHNHELVAQDQLHLLRINRTMDFLDESFIHKVVFSRRGDSISISCSCMLFVQEGLLCRHMFFILNMKEYDEIPSNFILRRWGKDIIADGLLRKKYSYPHKGSKNECLIQDAYAILRLSINKIANNEDELAKYIKQLQEVDSGIPLCTSSRASSSRSVHIEKIIGAAVPDVINIHNPEGIRNKGWASGKRIKSTREKVIEKSKKGTRLCSLCHKPNHNAKSCILRFKKSDLESEVTEG